jgi:hypothetical protein
MSPRRVFLSDGGPGGTYYEDYRQGEFVATGYHPCVGPDDDTRVSVTYDLQPIIESTPNVFHIGWTYTVGGIPSSFFTRVGNTTTAYEILGLNVMNGDYERLIDDEENCEIDSSAFVEFDIQVREYTISTTEPCTSFAVGSAVDATARLFLPTTSDDVVITIQITPSITKTILIRDADTFSCDGYETDGYVDESISTCLGTPDPIVTLSSRPLLGTND